MEKLIILIYILFLSLSSATNLKLDRSDHKALITIQRSLGFILVNESQPCTSPGVFCHPIISGSLIRLRVTRLRYSSLGLDGFLSPAIGKLTELKELSLNDNNLVDRVPSEIVGCRKLEILNLRNNLFVGNVMPEMGLLSKLSKMDLSKNMLSGNLSFLEQLTGLEYLSLANNQFSGRVPDSVWLFPNLQFVDLSGNSLMRGDFARRFMLVEGPTSFENGGEGITLAPADSPGPSPDSWNSPLPEVDGNVNNDKKKKDHKLGRILGFIIGLIAGGLSGLLVSVLFKMLVNLVKGNKKTGPTIFGSNVIRRRQDLAFLEQEDGMAALQVIGKGGCGEVYKAELPDGSGIMLAIKKVIQPPLDAAELTEEETQLLGKKMRQIKSEIMTVGKIRHRNLLPLLAHLPRPDCHYLVYEFMKNGSLQDMLEDVNQGRKELDWLARFRIAVGVAHGLEYLHFGQSPMIIHRDLKPANILLDDNMEAKIGDFGLAKTMPDANTHMTSSNVAGTLGYIAPEYHQTLKFTDKCDIYSFGVVLGVLVIGKLPSDEFFQDMSEVGLVGWMRNVMTSDNPIRAVDLNLLGNGCEEDMLLVLKIACFCTLEDPKQRPDSKNVRLMLAQIIKH